MNQMKELHDLLGKIIDAKMKVDKDKLKKHHMAMFAYETDIQDLLHEEYDYFIESLHQLLNLLEHFK